ncbi:sigma-70 family RNA polymerase sigma factor [Jidongwangia harbinensis]|uniref:sigma-70 family RNA polymerase sigma factor n=1 Tax=Jidongwangia harbinensis TaxID=2878561 RepID=UPI001CDA1986|nr:sigma-70 family RNA polymerase sigma factor [Jidongwangia harbinensis]MCA2211832.1 sigma-70 family RNA polymerase sigma factor [Jidongwangia harbinensis]
MFSDFPRQGGVEPHAPDGRAGTARPAVAEPEPAGAEPRPAGSGETPDAALRHLQNVHRPVLLAYITRLTKGDVHWAEDILQETLLRAWRNPEARNAEGRWNRAWLFTVARRITIDQVRAAQARPPEYFDERIEAHGDAQDDIDRLLDNREVRAALSSLPERLRTVLVEMYFRERSVPEAAEILNVPAGTVKSRTFYALRALRAALEERGFLAEGAIREGNSGTSSSPS